MITIEQYELFAAKKIYSKQIKFYWFGQKIVFKHHVLLWSSISIHITLIPLNIGATWKLKMET